MLRLLAGIIIDTSVLHTEKHGSGRGVWGMCHLHGNGFNEIFLVNNG